MKTMASVEQNSQEQGPCSQSAEQCSQGGESSDFLVLSQTPSMAGTINGSITDLPLSVMTATYDLSPDEVRKLLKDLLQENQGLKDSLNQNNKKMQQLLQTMMLWQEQVEKSYVNHKLVIEDLQKSVCQLQQEKKELQKMVSWAQQKFSTDDQKCTECFNLRKNFEKLKNDLEAAEKVKQEYTAELNCQKAICMQMKQHVVELSTEKDALFSDYKLLEGEKRELTALNNELQSQLSSLNLEEKKDDSVVTEDIEQGYTIVYHPGKDDSQHLEESGVESSSAAVVNSSQGLKAALMGLHEEHSKIMKLSRQLAEEQCQVTYLKSVIDKKDQHIGQLNQQIQVLQSGTSTTKEEMRSSVSALAEQGESLKDEFASSQEKMQVAFSYIQKYKERCDSLTTQLQMYQAKLQDIQASDATVEKLQAEVENLQSLLVQEQDNRLEDNKNLQSARLQFERLYKDYVSIMQKWNAYEKDQDTKKQQTEALKKIVERQYQESLDAVTAKSVTLEEELVEKANENSRLKGDVHVLKQETENIPILKAQVELYKQDFHAEQTARRACQSEVDKLKGEVQALWTQNQQLLDEINSRPPLQHQHIRGSHSRDPNKEGDSHHRHRQKHDEKIKNVHFQHEAERHKQSYAAAPEQNVMTCPKCDLGFTDLQALQNHVELCLMDDVF